MALTKCRQKYAVSRRNLKDNQRLRHKAIRRFAADSAAKRYFLLALRALYYGLARLYLFLRLIVCVVVGSLRLLPVWIWQQFRFCPGKKRGKVKNFYVIGHRGTAAHAVENTLEGCAEGMRIGANALEIDICITKDEQVVLWHDWDPDDLVARVRQAGLEPGVKYRPFVPMRGPMRRPVKNLTLADLQRHYGYSSKKRPPRRLDVAIPTLEQFLGWAKVWPQLRLVLLDVKIAEEDAKYVDKMAAGISSLMELEKPHFEILCLSPYKKIIEGLKRHNLPAAFSWDTELPPLIVLDPEEFSAVERADKLGNSVASSGRPTVLSLGPWTTYRRLVDFDMKALEKSQSVKTILGWTINRKREMRCLIGKGLHGIISDRPERLKKIFETL